MISIIICSRRGADCQLSQNISETIGNITYEIIWIDNSKNKYNIFQAYDEGLHRAKGDYLCYMHEDIIIHSFDWGLTAVRQMEENENVGMLGVIGGRYVSKYSDSWDTFQNMKSGSIIQGYSSILGRYKTFKVDYTDVQNKEVATIDGLWMFIRRNLFEDKVAWDSDTFSGFHYYDIDMSMQVVNAGYSIEVAPIIIEHKSQGSFNRAFWDSYVLFHKKWNSFLPVGTSSLSAKDKLECERLFLEIIKKDKTTIIEQRQLLNKLGYRQWHTLYLVIKNLLRKKQ